MTSIPLFSGLPLAYSLALIGNELLDAAANLTAAAWIRKPVAVEDPGDSEGAESSPQSADPLPPLEGVDVVANLLARATLTVPVIDWDGITYSTTETSVPIIERDARHGHRVTALVPGIRVTASAPFTGSRLLLTSRPTKHTVGGLDRGATLAGNHVELTMTGRHITHEAQEAYLTTMRNAIETHIEFAGADLTRWESEITASAIYAVQERAAFLAELSTFATSGAQ